MIDPEGLARLFHETYERLAPEHGYETRRDSAVPWDDVPENNRRLMVATAFRVLLQLNPPKWTVPAVVERVIDGDTAMLMLDLGWHVYRRERCRLADIDAPELPTDAGVLARNAAESLMPAGTKVTFESKALDNYGRPLGRILLTGGVDVGAELVKLGYAQPYKR